MPNEKLKNIILNSPMPKAHQKKQLPNVSLKIKHTFALMLIFSGIACLLFTKQVHSLLPFILGIIMLAIGTNDIARSFITKEFLQKETKLMASGIVFFILGGVILWHHKSADNLIGSFWGILGLIKGSETLNKSIYSFAEKKPFLKYAVHSIVEIWLGILLLLDPVSSVRHHVFILGLELSIVGWQILFEQK